MDGVLAPTTPQLDSSELLSSMTKEERHTWRTTDKLPERLTSPQAETPTAVETPAEPVEAESESDATTQEAESETPDAAVSEAARTLRRNRGEERKAKIQTEINELTRRKYELLEETNRMLRERGQPAAPQPAQAPAQPVQTNSVTFPTFDEWQGAHPDQDWSQYIRSAAKFEARQELEAERLTQATQRRIQTAAEKVTAFRAEHPDFDAVFLSNPLVVKTDGLIEALTDSDYGPNIAYHLGQHPEESRRLAGLDPVSFLKAFGRLEARFEAAPAAAATPPHAAPISSAPPPPPTLGSRPGTPVDPSRAALSRGDFRDFHRAETARGLAQGKATGRL